jgi:hypothetical protein
MTPNEAEVVLKDLEAILQQLSRYHQLTEEQRLAIHSRAGIARQKIGDVVKVLQKLKRAVDIQTQDG